MIERLAALFFEKGDIGHVALFLWAACASTLALVLLRELGRTSSRFEAFVMAIARLNAMLSSLPDGQDPLADNTDLPTPNSSKDET